MEDIKKKAKYIRIMGAKKPLSNKTNITLEFGQIDKLFSGKDTQVRGSDDKIVNFNSMIDALNWLDKYGYDFEQAYAFNIGGQNIYHYLMKRRD